MQTFDNSKFCLSTPFIVSLLRIICGEINDPNESVSYILKGRIDSTSSCSFQFVGGATTLSPLQRINRNWSKGVEQRVKHSWTMNRSLRSDMKFPYWQKGMVNESICCFVRFDEKKIFFSFFFRYVEDYNPFYGLCGGFSAQLDNERYLWSFLSVFIISFFLSMIFLCCNYW